MSHALARRVDHVAVDLTKAGSADERPDAESNHVELRLRRDPQQMLEEESIQLLDVQSDDQRLHAEYALDIAR